MLAEAFRDPGFVYIIISVRHVLFEVTLTHGVFLEMRKIA